jgi:hypothetical protein
MSCPTGSLREVYGALSLDKADQLRDRIFRWDRDHHVHVIRQQMPLLNPAFLPRSQLADYFPKMLSQLPVQRLSPALGNEDDVIFALPFGVA